MDIQLENVTKDEEAKLLMEIKIGRQMRDHQQVNLVLPKFSGDGGYTKGEVDFETWKYMAETYIDDNFILFFTRKNFINKYIEIYIYIYNIVITVVLQITNGIHIIYN